MRLHRGVRPKVSLRRQYLRLNSTFAGKWVLPAWLVLSSLPPLRPTAPRSSPLRTWGAARTTPLAHSHPADQLLQDHHHCVRGERLEPTPSCIIPTMKILCIQWRKRIAGAFIVFDWNNDTFSSNWYEIRKIIDITDQNKLLGMFRLFFVLCNKYISFCVAQAHNIGQKLFGPETYQAWNLSGLKPIRPEPIRPWNLSGLKPIRPETYQAWNLSGLRPIRPEAYQAWNLSSWNLSGLKPIILKPISPETYHPKT